MKIFLTVFFFLFLPFQAFAEPYRHEATGLVFPDLLAGMEKWRVTDLEKDRPGFGVSIGYNAPGITLTIYVYNLGMKSIPSDPKDPVFIDQFLASVGDIYRAGQAGVYTNLTRLYEKEISLTPAENAPKALLGAFSFLKRDKEGRSMLVLIGYKDHFLKVRYTYDKTLEPLAEAVFKKLLEDLAAMMQSAGRSALREPGAAATLYVCTEPARRACGNAP